MLSTNAMKWFSYSHLFIMYHENVYFILKVLKSLNGYGDWIHPKTRQSIPKLVVFIIVYHPLLLLIYLSEIYNNTEGKGNWESYVVRVQGQHWFIFLLWSVDFSLGVRGF